MEDDVPKQWLAPYHGDAGHHRAADKDAGLGASPSRGPAAFEAQLEASTLDGLGKVLDSNEHFERYVTYKPLTQTFDQGQD